MASSCRAHNRLDQANTQARGGWIEEEQQAKDNLEGSGEE